MTTISSTSSAPPPNVAERTAARQVPVAPPVPAEAESPKVAPVVTARPVEAVQAPTNESPPPSEASTAQLKQIAEELQKRVSSVAPELQFSVDQESGRGLIRVTDRRTNEVIRQIPSEEALQINKGIDRFQQGLLVNRKA